MKIYAPVKDTNGVYASVRFVDGVGETDNPNLIEWFKSHGYGLEEETFNYIIKPKNEQIEVKNEQIEVKSPRVEIVPTAPLEELEMLEQTCQPDLDSMTPNELRQWAISQGLGSKIRNTRNKEKLLEILRG